MKKLAPQLAESIELKDIGRYVKDDRWVMEQKLDGHRIMAICGNTPAFLNRHGVPYAKSIPRNLERDVKNLLLPGFILDGELVGSVLWVFDMLHEDGSLDELPLSERRKVLEALLASAGPSIRIVPQAQDAETKQKLVMKSASRGYEGIVIKKADSTYTCGGRSANWLKAKYVSTIDVLVSGIGDDGKESATLSVYDGGTRVEIGRCSLIGKGGVKVGDVVEVMYLYANDPAKPRLYQPRLMRVRFDKGAHECTVDQLRFTNKSVMEDIT